MGSNLPNLNNDSFVPLELHIKTYEGQMQDRYEHENYAQIT
jgi:hypothetical protein